ncbi:MAG: aldehyde dehydrogenase family protein [Acidobacteriota bacterium]|nr:aldehyde dehydrogenase family protein [Acidobacteriota bacterium]MDQ5835567.1 aldehyde dehydrogenase family protein [Acidobacteriota bacterium]
MRRMFINGEFVESLSGETFVVGNPATEETIDEVPRARAEDAEAAVRSAHAAWDDWRFMPGIEKCELLHAVARKMREHREELARLLTLEGGKPLIENMDEVEWVAACFDYYAEVGRHESGRVIPPVQRHQMNFVVKEPYGVVVCIVPWNYPLLLLAWKVAPALMAGNTVVVKPSEHTPLSTLLLAEVAFAELPPGVFNVVTGYGDEVGEPLVRHPLTPVIAFTGSVATGRRIATLAAERIKRVNLELGGNDPFIVCDDVDLDVAVRGAVWAAFLNMGQVCTSGERFYVFESVAEKFIDGFVEFTGKLRLGDPLGPDVDLGPMISAPQREKVEQKLDRVREMGARVLCGGKRPEKFSRGYFFEPTVVTGVDHTMPLMREETFGPVAPIMVVRGIDEAVALANDSEYGLGANILTNSLEYALTAAERIKAGTFWINDPLTDNDAGPFGGMRLSGGGRELGSEGIEEFRETKHIHLDYKLEAKPYWYPYDWSKGRKTD